MGDPVIEDLELLYRHLLTKTEPWARRKAAELGRVMDGEADLEAAFGLVGRWRQKWFHVQRNAMIREAIALHLPGPIAPAAEKFAKALAHYALTGWKADRLKPRRDCPYPPGSLKAAMFHTMKLGGTALGKDQIRTILSA